MIQIFTEGVDPSFIKAAISDDTVIILWLVGFNVFQGILIILILVLCTNQRAKYKRRLKAATIGNSVISDTLLRNRAQPVMQGTIHILRNETSIHVFQKIILVRYEHDFFSFLQFSHFYDKVYTYVAAF